MEADTVAGVTANTDADTGSDAVTATMDSATRRSATDAAVPGMDAGMAMDLVVVTEITAMDATPRTHAATVSRDTDTAMDAVTGTDVATTAVDTAIMCTHRAATIPSASRWFNRAFRLPTR